MQLKNKTDLKEIRRELRTNGTPAEAVMWQALKARRLDGWRWRRQFSIGGYILDFYCPKAKLGIELDGAPHFTPQGAIADGVKLEFLEDLDIRVLHFENHLLRDSSDIVLDTIRRVLNDKDYEP